MVTEVFKVDKDSYDILKKAAAILSQLFLNFKFLEPRPKPHIDKGRACL